MHGQGETNHVSFSGRRCRHFHICCADPLGGGTSLCHRLLPHAFCGFVFSAPGPKGGAGLKARKTAAQTGPGGWGDAGYALRPVDDLPGAYQRGQLGSAGDHPAPLGVFAFCALSGGKAHAPDVAGLGGGPGGKRPGHLHGRCRGRVPALREPLSLRRRGGHGLLFPLRPQAAPAAAPGPLFPLGLRRRGPGFGFSDPAAGPAPEGL